MMADHGTAVGAAIGPIVAGEVLLTPSCPYPWRKALAMGKGPAMRIRTREYIVLHIRPFWPDPAVHQFAILGQRRLSKAPPLPSALDLLDPNPPPLHPEPHVLIRDGVDL